MKTILFAALVSTAMAGAWAQNSPVGVWKTIDDKTKTERSIVRITESGGVLSGHIEKLLAPDAKQDAKCDKCEDDRKDKAVIGLEIIRGVKKNDDVWDGGTILDATEGKVYKVRLKPEDDGKKLQVRGYIGLFYRNQYWIRVE